MVSYKKVGLLATIWMFILTVFTQIAMATPTPIPAGIQAKVAAIFTFEWLGWIGLPIVSDPIEGLIRTLLLIGLFALFFKLGSELKLGQQVSMALAALFSLMSVIFIPSSVLLAAGASMGTLFGVILLAIPLGSLLMMYKFFNDNPFMRVFILAVQSYVLWEMVPYVTGKTYSGAAVAGSLSGVGGTYGGLMAGMGSLIYTIFALTIVLLLYELMKMIPSSSNDGSGLSGFLNKHWDKNKHRIPGTDAADEHKETLKSGHAAKTTELSEYIEEKKEHELIEEALSEAETFDAVVADAIINGIQTKAPFVSAFELVTAAVHNASTEVRRLKKTTFREERKLKALMKEIHDKGINAESYNGKAIEVYERDLLAIHDKIMVELKKLDKEMGKSGLFGKQVDAIKAQTTGWPLTLGKNIGGKPVPNVLRDLKQGIDNLTASLKVIETEQAKSYKESEGLIAATKKFWK